MDLLTVWRCLLFVRNFTVFLNCVTFNDESISNSSNDFDVLIFTQLYPATVCFDLKQTTNISHCNLPNEERWTIHGIWPTKYNTYYPAECNPSLQFDPSLLQNIRDELNINWLYVVNKTHPEIFWKHEWDKHGTCSVVIDSLNTQTKYFQKGLDLFDKYNAKNILQNAQIISGQHYPVQTILERVDKILGVKSYVDCVKSQEGTEQYLHELRICFDISFNLTDCEGIKNFPSNCDPLIDVIYPKTGPNCDCA